MKAHVHHVFDDSTNTLTYVVWDPGTLDAVIIDPVLDYDPVGSQSWTGSVDNILELVRAHGLHVHYVLETHAHADHLSGSQPLRQALAAKLAIGEHIVEVQRTFQRLFDLPPSFHSDGRQFDCLLRDGDHLLAGALSIEVIATPGHTPACVSYKIGAAVFTGDALFMDDYGTGRCDFPEGSADALFTSIQRLYLLPDDTRVFVGHDYLPNGRALRWETTIGASKRSNPQLNASTSREAFVWLRNQRDATLAAPRLLFQSVQVNISGGRLPEAGANGVRYFKLPLNLFRPADQLGRPIASHAEPEPR